MEAERARLVAMSNKEIKAACAAAKVDISGCVLFSSPPRRLRRRLVCLRRRLVLALALTLARPRLPALTRRPAPISPPRPA